MELAERKMESVEDITAADTAPSPTNDTGVGVRYCSTMGRISVLSKSTVTFWLLTLPVGGL